MVAAYAVVVSCAAVCLDRPTTGSGRSAAIKQVALVAKPRVDVTLHPAFARDTFRCISRAFCFDVLL